MLRIYIPQVTDSVFLFQETDTTAVDSGISASEMKDSVFIHETEPLSGAFDLPEDTTDRYVTTAARSGISVQKKTDSFMADAQGQDELRWNFNDNFLDENPLSKFKPHEYKDTPHTIADRSWTTADLAPAAREKGQKDWFTGIGLLLVFLLIWIRIYFGKYFSSLADSIANFQIAAKNYFEKNVLTRRASFMLNLIYFIVFAIFIYELAVQFNLVKINITDLYLFVMILFILLVYSLIRIALLHMTGFIFDNRSVFSEYIHHTFIFNKGMGVILFPFTLAALYIPTGLAAYVLIPGLAICLITFAFKVIRSVKIFMNKDILLFYLILYLCTLEFLPLLLGYKALKLLIRSY